MREKIEIGAITNPVVTLAQVKTELGVGHDLRDLFLRTAIEQAIEYISMYTGRPLADMEVTKTVIREAADPTALETYGLWLLNVTEITACTDLDDGLVFTPVRIGYNNHFIVTEHRNFTIAYKVEKTEAADRYVPVLISYVSALLDGATDLDTHITINRMLYRAGDSI